jgi:hypothetical protein
MRIFLCLLLAAVAIPAWAKWVKVSEDNEATYYADPVTVRKDGNIRRMWELQDLKKRYKNREMSRRYLSEYDCKERRHRMLTISAHSEPMARGTLLATEGTSTWDYIAPHTDGAAILEVVCTK